MRRLVALAAAAALFLGGCGSRDETKTSAAGPATTVDAMAGMPGMGAHTDMNGNPTSDCAPAGTTLSITASSTKFSTDCLAAPASRPFTVNFDNKDSFSHNLTILESHHVTESLFDAGSITGPGLKTFTVPALKPGVYAFHCKFHSSQMSGTFVVK